jgi:hypothetical protein
MSIHTDAVASAHSRMRAQLDQTLDAGQRGLQHYATTTSWCGATSTSPRRWACSTATLILAGLTKAASEYRDRHALHQSGCPGFQRRTMERALRAAGIRPAGI